MRASFPQDRKVQVGFGSAIVTLLVVGALSYRSIVVSSESDLWVRHTQEVLDQLQDLRVAMETVETSVRGYVVTGNDSYLVAYRASRLGGEQDEAAVEAGLQHGLAARAHIEEGLEIFAPAMATTEGSPALSMRPIGRSCGVQHTTAQEIKGRSAVHRALGRLYIGWSAVKGGLWRSATRCACGARVFWPP